MNDGVTVHHLREAETGEADVGAFEFFDQLLGSFLLGGVVVVELYASTFDGTVLRGRWLRFDRRSDLRSGRYGRVHGR